MATQKENQENLVSLLKKWQKIEEASIKNAAKVIENTDNPLLIAVMQIIKSDSANHKKIEQLIIDHYEKETLKLNPEELMKFWDLIEEHNDIEKKTIELAKQALADVKQPIPEYLLRYLLKDEQKHDELLEEMEKIKGGMYPYGG